MMNRPQQSKEHQDMQHQTEVQRLNTVLDQMEADNAKNGYDTFEGVDWYQITPEELWIFNIDIEDWPRAIGVFELYECAKGIVHPQDMSCVPDVDKLRTEIPWLKVSTTMSNEEYMNFAELFGVTRQNAWVASIKVGFWIKRLE